MLTVRKSLPDGFLHCGARELERLLGGPTLIELEGRREAPLFVSILMHGNEDVGLGAMQRVLRSRNIGALPRNLMLSVGNVAAAAEGRRRLENQPDYNRIWPGGGLDSGCREADMMADIHERVLAREAFAAIDLHNNTGRNPHYSVVCTTAPEVLGLASMFARRAVLFRGLPGTQTAAFGNAIPAMTAECGMPGSSENETLVAEFIDRVLDLEQLPTDPQPRGLTLFHTLGAVRIRPDVAFSFGNVGAALVLDPELDRLNFEAQEPGTVLARTNHPAPLELIDEDGLDRAGEYFEVADGELRLARPATPAMLTLDATVVRQDCLGYLMEPLDWA